MKGITIEIAELLGLFCADGCMQKDYICFWGNISGDRDYYDKIVSKFFEKAFGIRVNPHEKISNSVYGFYVCNREVINYFKRFGFKPGNKTFTVSVPKAILKSKVQDIQLAFIRGLLAGDGCLYFSKKYGNCRKILRLIHTYPQISISSVSESLMRDTKRMLDKIGIKSFIYTNYNINYKNFSPIHRLEVRGKERLELWKNKIGFRNLGHITKYKFYKKFGFVPPKIKIAERKKILRNKISPWEYYSKRTRSLVDRASV